MACGRLSQRPNGRSNHSIDLTIEGVASSKSLAPSTIEAGRRPIRGGRENFFRRRGDKDEKSAEKRRIRQAAPAVTFVGTEQIYHRDRSPQAKPRTARMPKLAPCLR